MNSTVQAMNQYLEKKHQVKLNDDNIYVGSVNDYIKYASQIREEKPAPKSTFKPTPVTINIHTKRKVNFRENIDKITTIAPGGDKNYLTA